MTLALANDRLQLAEHYRTAYAVVLPDDHSLDNALVPGYWAHVSTRLRQHDIIQVIPESGVYFAELIVLNAGRGFAKVALLRRVDFEEADEEVGTDNGGLMVKWHGPAAKFVVIRKADGYKLKEGFIQKQDAQRWLDDHLKSLDH